MEERFLMSRKERESLKVFTRVKAQSLTRRQAAELLQISYRQCLRRYQRFLRDGDKGLLHRARGKPSNRAFDSKTKDAILALYQTRYPDFGPTLAAEQLAKAGFEIDHETLRRWLIRAGLWHKRRSRSPHRSWRERRWHFGELIQMDGSHHHWFEERADSCCLMNMVDDATGTTLSLLAAEETTHAALSLLSNWIARYGIPAALYTDRKNVYLPSAEAIAKARLEGRQQLTQFGRACQQLGIRIIAANSPQAKGRVERSHGVYQDRLVKELRLEQISQITEANELLSTRFINELNAKFAVAPRRTGDYHRAVSGYDLAQILSIQEQRSLSPDWIVRFDNHYYQLARQSKRAPAKSRVAVSRHLNGELHFYYRGQEISYQQLTERPVKQGKEKPAGKKGKEGKESVQAKHPWRRTPWSKKERLKQKAETQKVTFLKS